MHSLFGFWEMVRNSTLERTLLLVGIAVATWTISLLHSHTAVSLHDAVLPFTNHKPLEIASSKVSSSSYCQGKEPVLEILKQAGETNVTTNCSGLPTWNQISSLYGDKPVIVGLETCPEYRNRLLGAHQNSSIPRIAGMYNTGTNALGKLLQVNWNSSELAWFNDKSHFQWDVPWGKHVPLTRKSNVTVPPANPTPKHLVLPIVIVRDPFWWMQSMCKNPYGAKWKHTDQHCPNLVDGSGQSVPVTTKYWFGKQTPTPIRFQMDYDSLVDVWSIYYRQYWESPDPRLMIRFEDILFHGPAVLEQISNCVGIRVNKPFEYYIAKSKHHGQGGTGFVQALIKYGSTVGRTDRLTQQDLDFAKKRLDAELLGIFRYRLA